MTNTSTHYQILGLPEGIRTEAVIPAQTLRSAYRRALLQNHPDKSQLQTSLTPKTIVKCFSIDQISQAFAILSNPKSRATYDKELKLQVRTTNNGGVKGQQGFRTGVETVDLDDLEIDEQQGIWYRGCRCGDERGFLIAESDLEEAADDGELGVGCRGCSLWLKVLFGVIGEDDPIASSKNHSGNT